MLVAQVGRDEEVLETIAQYARERGVTSAALTLVGAVHECTVSVMPKGDPLDDILTDYHQPFELTGTGEIIDGNVHIHVTLGGDGLIVSGHLHRAIVRDWFVRAYLHPLD